MSTRIPPVDPSCQKITFSCPGCGTRLGIDSHQAGTSGPCPVCGANIVSPDATVASPRPSGKSGSTFKKRRIQADAVIDQDHLGQRESMRSLRVIALFILTACACVVVAWFLKDHLAN